MRERPALVLYGALIAMAWGLFGLAFATWEEPGPKSTAGVFVVCICLSVVLSWWAVVLLQREWRGRVGRFDAAPVSGFAALSVLWLGLVVTNTLSEWLVAFAVFAALPFGLALVITVLTQRRWPGNGRWMALFGATLAVCIPALISLSPRVHGTVGHKAGKVVYIALLAYIPWLLGMRAAIWFRSQVRRRRKNARRPRGYDERLAEKAFEARAAKRG